MTIDDAYIGARYARNMARGLGLVFNRGERVEGFSDPLWVAAMACACAIGVHPIVAAKVLGVSATLAALAIANRELAHTGPGRSALVVFAMVPSIVLWSVAGLETTTYSAALLLALTWGSEAIDREKPYAGASALLGTVALLRPEGGAFVAVLVLSALYDDARRGRRPADAAARLVRNVAPFPVVFATYVAFRRLYYGEWVPNTYFVKVGGALHSLGDGIRYAAGQGHSPAAVVLVGSASIAALRLSGERTLVRTLALGCGLQLAFIAWSGGDWMPLGRFLVPLYFLTLIPAGFGLAWLAERWGGGEARPRAWVAATACLLVAQMADTVRDVRASYWRLGHGLDTRLAFGEWIQRHLDADLTVAYGDAGALPFASDLLLLDLNGLVDRRIGRILYESRTSCVASRDACVAEADTRLARLVFERRPDLVLLPTRTPPDAGPWKPEDYGAALVGDPEFERTYERVGNLLVYPPSKVKDWAQGRYLVTYVRRDTSVPGLAAVERCISDAIDNETEMSRCATWPGESGPRGRAARAGSFDRRRPLAAR